MLGAIFLWASALFSIVTEFGRRNRSDVWKMKPSKTKQDFIAAYGPMKAHIVYNDGKYPISWRLVYASVVDDLECISNNTCMTIEEAVKECKKAGFDNSSIIIHYEDIEFNCITHATAQQMKRINELKVLYAK